MRRGQEYITSNLPAMHRDLTSMTRTDAQNAFIRELLSSPLCHNFHLYRLRRHKYDNVSTIWIAVCPRGLEILEVNVSDHSCCICCLFPFASSASKSEALLICPEIFKVHSRSLPPFVWHVQINICDWCCTPFPVIQGLRFDSSRTFTREFLQRYLSESWHSKSISIFCLVDFICRILFRTSCRFVCFVGHSLMLNIWCLINTLVGDEWLQEPNCCFSMAEHREASLWCEYFRRHFNLVLMFVCVCACVYACAVIVGILEAHIIIMWVDVIEFVQIALTLLHNCMHSCWRHVLPVFKLLWCWGLP